MAAPVPPLRRLRRRRGGGAGRGRRGAHGLARDGTPDRPGAWLTTAAQRNALDLFRPRGRREQRPAGSPRRRGDRGTTTSRPPTTGSPCCSRAVTRRWRPRPGCRSPCVPSSVSPPRRSPGRSWSTSDAGPADRAGQAQDRRRPASTCGSPTASRSGCPTYSPSIYLMYNEGFVSSTGAPRTATSAPTPSGWPGWSRPAFRTRRRPGAWRHCSRSSTGGPPRASARGRLVLLRDQDRIPGTAAPSSGAGHYLERAASLRAPGRYQLQAAIAACHAEAPVLEGDRLAADRHVVRRPPRAGPVTRGAAERGHRARQLGPRQAAPALAEVEALAERLEGYHLWHATRAELLRLQRSRRRGRRRRPAAWSSPPTRRSVG